MAVTGDLKQAFHQVRIQEEDRDAIRFHWLEDLKTKRVVTLRFTRALSLDSRHRRSCFGGVLEEHLRNCKSKYPEEVEEIKRNLYVDHLIGGGENVSTAQHQKNSAQAIFSEAHFELHKWHSNEEALEVEETNPNDQDQTYAKEQLGVTKGETKLLGMPWSKVDDTLAVEFPTQPAEPTKRGTLAKIAKVYDPLGLVSPVTLTGKVLYREACDLHVAWDKPLPNNLIMKWNRWEQSLRNDVKFPRSLPKFQEKIDAIDLHAFGDASARGVSTAVNAVVHQPSGMSRGLVTAKSRLSKKGLTIPRLELVSGHMSANLLDNVKGILQDFPVQNTYGWLDNTVALHWIRGKDEYRQFVHNRVRKIQERSHIQWRHVCTDHNSADLGSQGGKVDQTSELWWNGPSWLSHPQDWPQDITISTSKETEKEAKIVREVLAVTVPQENDQLDEVIQKWEFRKVIRITAWITRFIRNAKVKRRARIEHRCENTKQFHKDRLKLNLQKDGRGVYECRVDSKVTILYIPTRSSSIYREARDECPQSHLGNWPHDDTYEGKILGPTFTTTGEKGKEEMHRMQRVPRNSLRKTTRSSAFQVIGMDYAGPIPYRVGKNRERKSYILLYACSLSTALHLELLPDLTTEEFIHSLKRFIARRGRPEKIYSDNGKTFVAAVKWLKKVMKEEQFHGRLAEHKIRWAFNLSRAPWWGAV